MEKKKIILSIDQIPKEFTVERTYCIGYTGRNKEKVYEHIQELAEIGIPEPVEVPMLYPVSAYTVNQNNDIQVIGNKTSGEAELVLMFEENEVFLTVGSDHTDRGLETVDINKSKQVCDKPIGTEAWHINEVLNHWDELIIRSEQLIENDWVLYQENPVSSIITYDEILAFLKKKEVSLNNTLVLAGTVPLSDGFKYGQAFKMKIIDPVRKKEIQANYTVTQIA